MENMSQEDSLLSTNDDGSLSGTQIKSLREQVPFEDVEALIEETLKETRLSKETVDETSLSGTKLSEDFSKHEDKQVVFQETKKEEKVKAENDLENQYEETFKSYSVGDIIKGTVVSISATGALVDIQYQTDGFVDINEVNQFQIKTGDIVDVYITSLSNREGYVELSIKRAKSEQIWKKLYDAFEQKTLLYANVNSSVAGGLITDIEGVRGFIPASQVFRQQNQQLSDFVGKVLPVKVLEINRKQNKLILSHKQGRFDEIKREKDRFFEQIQVGQVLHGKVSNIKKFGVFVDVNGIEGLIHLNDLSWKKVDDPSKIVSVGQEIDVFVVGVNKEEKKISFGLKQLQPTPWDSVLAKYKVGDVIDVKVLRYAKFGVFVEVEEGVEGLVHNSELSIGDFKNPQDVLKIGEIVKAKIIKIDTVNQKIGLSVKQVELEEQKRQLEQLSNKQKVTIGDAIGESLKEQLNNQNELSQNS